MSGSIKVRLLVVADEQSIRKLCMTIGNSLGYACSEAESVETAVARIEQEAPDLILTDLKLPTQSGVELLRQAKALFPHTEVAIMTGHGSIESAVDAMKLGAYDYIEKPFRDEKCIFARACQHGRQPRRNHRRFREHPGCPSHDFTAEGYSHSCAGFRRKRNWQRTRRARHPLSRSHGPNSLRRRRLRLARPNFDGKRTFRL